MSYQLVFPKELGEKEEEVSFLIQERKENDLATFTGLLSSRWMLNFVPPFPFHFHLNLQEPTHEIEHNLHKSNNKDHHSRTEVTS